jgi:hypothetical protein
LWRTEENHGYYADRIGPLTLNDRIEARGKVVLRIGLMDSDMALGFFNSATHPSRGKSFDDANFLGIRVGGPTRKGHMFNPACASSRGSQMMSKDAPVLIPGKAYEWRLVYDPLANGGNGSIRVNLGGETVTLDFKPGLKAEGATFDRFGLLTVGPGGSLVRLYLDDLQYTVSSKP